MTGLRELQVTGLQELQVTGLRELQGVAGGHFLEVRASLLCPFLAGGPEKKTMRVTRVSRVLEKPTT